MCHTPGSAGCQPRTHGRQSGVCCCHTSYRLPAYASLPRNPHHPDPDIEPQRITPHAFPRYAAPLTTCRTAAYLGHHRVKLNQECAVTPHLRQPFREDPFSALLRVTVGNASSGCRCTCLRTSGSAKKYPGRHAPGARTYPNPPSCAAAHRTSRPDRRRAPHHPTARRITQGIRGKTIAYPHVA